MTKKPSFMEKAKIYRVFGIIAIFLGIISGYRVYFSLLPELFEDWSPHTEDKLEFILFLIWVFIFYNPFIWLALHFFRRGEQIQNPNQKRTRLTVFIKFYIGGIVFLFLFGLLFIAPHL